MGNARSAEQRARDAALVDVKPPPGGFDRTLRAIPEYRAEIWFTFKQDPEKFYYAVHDIGDRNDAIRESDFTNFIYWLRSNAVKEMRFRLTKITPGDITTRSIYHIPRGILCVSLTSTDKKSDAVVSQIIVATPYKPEDQFAKWALFCYFKDIHAWFGRPTVTDPDFSDLNKRDVAPPKMPPSQTDDFPARPGTVGSVAAASRNLQFTV